MADLVHHGQRQVRHILVPPGKNENMYSLGTLYSALHLLLCSLFPSLWSNFWNTEMQSNKLFIHSTMIQMVTVLYQPKIWFDWTWQALQQSYQNLDYNIRLQLTRRLFIPLYYYMTNTKSLVWLHIENRSLLTRRSVIS